MNIFCAACKTEVEFLEKVGVRDTCPSCEAWLHSCVNCGLWINSQCTEPSAEKVRDPEGMNFCEWFVVSTQDAARSTQKNQRRDEAEELWKKLTKK